MERKVYVKSFARISLRHPDPDYGGMFPVMEARRMSLLMKRALAVSRQALDKAGVAVPAAVITGTGLGCIENTEKFLRSLAGLSGEPLRPTHFMQSTHNTIGSLIAIRLKCHGYNATYSHSAVSFESALLDAFLQVRLGLVDPVLVGAFEEMTPDCAAIGRKAGFTGLEVDGRLSETAVSLVLSGDPAGALCEVAAVDMGTPEEDRAGETARLTRPEYVALYGDNFCVSALGACDAVQAVADGRHRALLLENDVPGKSFASILFKAI